MRSLEVNLASDLGLRESGNPGKKVEIQKTIIGENGLKLVN